MAIQTNELMDVQELRPFKKFIMSIGAIPTSYLESMSYAELLMWFCNYLQNTVIPTINNNAEAVEEVQNAFTSFAQAVNDEIERFETGITTDFDNLEDFVNNYFDNNFPELVSDKLDEMAENGTLENLLNNYAHILKVYNTYADMIADSSTFTNGLRLKTLGYYNINDGGQAEYYVNNSIIATNYQVDLQNGLYLNLITNNKTINIKQLGAKGDGITDDTDSIINAISIGNDIFIPSGTYLITDTIKITKNIHLFGIGRESRIASNTDIVLIEISGSGIIANIEKLQFKNTATSRVNNGVYCHNMDNLIISEVNFNNIEHGGIFNLFVKTVITSIIEKSIFNHASIKLETWDAKINKCYIWSLSQDYGILVGENSGNINIIDVDIVPPLQSNSNYVTHANRNSNWSTASQQAGIVIGANGYAVTNVKMLGVYIDGNGSLTTGRGIIINKNSSNILLNNWSANKTNDDLVIIDSSYGVTVSNGQITDCYGNDCCLIEVIKTSGQICHNIDISHNTIILRDSTQLPTHKLRSAIESLDSDFSGTISYNKAFANGSAYTNAINVYYKPGYLLYTNRMSGARFFAEESGSVPAGATSKTISYGGEGLKYTPKLANISLAFTQIVNYRIQQIDADTIYVAFSEALPYGANYDLIVKL